MGRRWLALVITTVLALLVPSMVTVAHADVDAGETVWIGAMTQGHSGSSMHAVYSPVPADTANPGVPDYWAYCIEHDVSAKTNTTAVTRLASSLFGADYLDDPGSNYYGTDPTVAGKVRWIISNSYPALSLADFAAAAGVPGLSQDDAVEAVQYAIWRYTDLTFDANWNWAGSDSEANAEAAYWYLIGKINQGNTMSADDIASVTASVTAPAGAQQAGTLVGPFTVHTNQPTASVTVAPGVTVTDSTGAAINAAAVVDGQEIYLDLRASTSAGSATVTVSAQGAGGTGMVIAVPTVSGGTPTAANHRQTMILVAPSNATTTGTAAVNWSAAPSPSIGTTLVDDSDQDHVLAWNGGTLVDTVAYANLVPGREYTVAGELMRKSDGSATGITGSTTFTATAASGTVDVEFTVPAGFAGEVLVAFEELFEGPDASGNAVAEHKDINDAAQTVTVEDEPAAPSIGTTLVDDSDQDHVLAWNGGTLVDTVAYANLVPGREYTVAGELMRKSDGSATGITGSTTFTATAASGTVDVEFTVPAGFAGEVLVAFEELFEGPDASGNAVAEHKDINDAAQTVTVEDEPTVPATPKARPKLTTQTSNTVAAPGVRLYDTVKISGFVAGHGAKGSATLYGPFASRAAMSCAPAKAVKTVGFAPRNGVIRTPKVRITKTGFYTWVARTTSDSRNHAASHACGLKSETSLVRKPGYRSPRVDTGYSSPGSHAARTRATTVSIPSIGVNASVSTVTAPNNVMRIPSNVAELGQLNKSAGIGDLIGATVIAGHVSDRHDRPGAFSRLSKVKKGQIVTVKSGGKTVRYRVTAVEKFSRDGKMPKRLFRTTGGHGLTLISCTGRISTPGGGFHYSQNVAVSAKRLS